MNHLHPFGVVCYAFIASEQRGKIEPTRMNCRLIGYADDDDTEEMAGYKLIIEEDQNIIFCNDVIFSENFEKLPSNEPYDPIWHDVFSFDENIQTASNVSYSPT